MDDFQELEKGPALAPEPPRSLGQRISDANLQGVIFCSFYMPLIAATGFACSVRTLPWWYQLLVAICTVVAVINLWLTNRTGGHLCCTDAGYALHAPAIR